MLQVRNYGDKRQLSQCIYCGNNTETKDHVPSKIFLDKPYPENLPTVPACRKCNNSFSLDEEYLACLVDCSKNGTIEPEHLERKKIRDILSNKAKLKQKLHDSMSLKGNKASFSIENTRVKNVILKLAQGHTLFENNELILEAPSSTVCLPIHLIDAEARKIFESPVSCDIFPEVVSRAMQRTAFLGSTPYYIWIDVQPGRYRYMVTDKFVRIVIGEYLACEILW